MLTEAQIEIVDDAGNVEDRVRIVGTGEVALATTDRAWLQLTPEDPADVDAIIALRGGSVTIEAKKDQALRVDDEFLPRATPRDVPQGLTALIAAVRRTLRVRTLEVPNASLMSPGGAVIREETSEFERWLSESAARGAAKVSEQLADLRTRGMIDEHGNLLVPLPEDMNPDSKTDV
jgi:hypothetical protein